MTRLSLSTSLFLFALTLAVPQAVFAAKDRVVVANVNGLEIFRADIEEARLRLPERFNDVPLEAVYGLLVNSLIDSKLVAGEARKINLDKDPDFRKQLARIEEQVLERAFLTAYINKRITDQALAERYEEMVRQVAVKEEINARHILLETEAQAREVIAELKGGADFAELAKSRSKGPSGAEGGDLGFFGEGQMVPAFSDAAFALKPGDMTEEPVQTQFGWHVIKVEDRRTVQPPTLEESEQDLRLALSREIGAAFLQELRKSATVERFNLDGTPLKDDDAAQ